MSNRPSKSQTSSTVNSVFQLDIKGVVELRQLMHLLSSNWLRNIPTQSCLSSSVFGSVGISWSGTLAPHLTQTDVCVVRLTLQEPGQADLVHEPVSSEAAQIYRTSLKALGKYLLPTLVKFLSLQIF